MLYNTLQKPFSEYKNKLTKTAEPERFASEFNSSAAKNMWASLNKMSKHKRGRKILQKQSRLGNTKGTASPQHLRSMHSSDPEKKQTPNHPNCTIYQIHRSHKGKTHTYNPHQQSTERSDDAENEVRIMKERTFYKKKSQIAPQPAFTPEPLRKTNLEKRFGKDKHVTTKEEQLDQNQSEFLQPMARTHIRKLSFHNRLAPIDSNQSTEHKPSLVDLIKKFKFQNLKTNNENTESSESLKQTRKYAESSLARQQPKQKTHAFFKEEDTSRIFYGGHVYKQHLSRKPSKESKDDQKRGNNLIALKKSNSILSPWGTIADHYFIQPLID